MVSPTAGTRERGCPPERAWGGGRVSPPSLVLLVWFLGGWVLPCGCTSARLCPWSDDCRRWRGALGLWAAMVSPLHVEPPKWVTSPWQCAVGPPLASARSLGGPGSRQRSHAPQLALPRPLSTSVTPGCYSSLSSPHPRANSSSPPAGTLPPPSPPTTVDALSSHLNPTHHPALPN